MLYLITKYTTTALIVVLVSELAKRSTLAGAILASIPTVSVLAMIWIYIETRDTARLASFSIDVVWLVLPSLALFAVLPLLLRIGVGFWWSLAAGLAATALAYWGSIEVMSWLRGRWEAGVMRDRSACLKRCAVNEKLQALRTAYFCF